MSWANAGFHVLGQHVLWTDLIGNVAALATVWLAIRRTIWTWPVQFAGAVLLFTASVSAGIAGNALKQVLFGALAAFGWWKWSRGIRDQGGDLAVRPATGRERLVLLVVMAAGTAAAAALLAVSGWSWAPLPDAYIFVGSAVATFAQSRALVDFWLIWVAVDLVGVPLALMSGLWVSGAVYGVFFVMVLFGFRNWLLLYRRRAADRAGADMPDSIRPDRRAGDAATTGTEAVTS